jgi:hypothetical protein
MYVQSPAIPYAAVMGNNTATSVLQTTTVSMWIPMVRARDELHNCLLISGHEAEATFNHLIFMNKL